jgi:hypothetical protein
MKKSIFDSNSEKIIFKRLKTFWSKYVDIFPQIPIRSVIDYESIKTFSKNPKTIDFLLKTSFDFVVCELETGIPILIIEFDGLTGGFSQEGKFYNESNLKTDPYRKLKMETKLKLCRENKIPMIAVSYNESNLLSESGDWISILDAIIGDSIEKRYYEKNYNQYMNMLSEAYECGGSESVEMTSIEIDTINEQYNPIKLKIKKITDNFPFWPMQIIFPQENENWLFGKFTLSHGLQTINNSLHTKKILQIDLKIRKVGVFDSDSIFLFNTIGEYCLARKTEHILGGNFDKWNEAIKSKEWTKI